MNWDLLQSEEAKRDRNWAPRQRWRLLQETIAWADAQQRTPRNSKAGCLAQQAKRATHDGAPSARESPGL